MKPVNWLPLATAIAGGLVALGIHASKLTGDSQSATRTEDREEGRPGAMRARAELPNRPGEAQRSPWVEKQVVGRAGLATNHAVLSELQWHEQAARVEREATHELDRLVELLDLDPVQQGEVFSILARNSRAWLPGMKTTTELDSAPPAAGTDRESSPEQQRDLTSVLSPEQQRVLIREEMDRQAWWAEVLPQLLPPVIPGGGDPPLPPGINPYDGSDVLLEE